MSANAQTPWHSAPLRRRRFGPTTAELAERVLAQAGAKRLTAINRVRKAMTKSSR